MGRTGVTRNFTCDLLYELPTLLKIQKKNGYFKTLGFQVKSKTRQCVKIFSQRTKENGKLRIIKIQNEYFKYGSSILYNRGPKIIFKVSKSECK